MNDFPAIPLLELRPYDRIRELYLYLEPSLMAAIRLGDYGESRRLINQIRSFSLKGFGIPSACR